MIPHLRLIHVIADHDHIKAAYLRSLDVLNKTELDGSKSTLTRRVDAWELIADKWKDPEYNPSTVAFSNLHKEFIDPIDLSYSHVEQMEISSIKAKDKFNDMKNQLLMLKVKWEKSGTGECTPKESASTGDVMPTKTNLLTRNIESDYGDPNNVEVSDGTHKRHDYGDPDNVEVFDGSQKRHFLGNRSPCILYL